MTTTTTIQIRRSSNPGPADGAPGSARRPTQCGPGRAAVPGELPDLSLAGHPNTAVHSRQPSATGHYASALPETALSDHGGRSPPVPDARRVGDASSAQDLTPTALDTLVARLHAAASHAGQVARGTEILAARLQVSLPPNQSCHGIDDAVQHHQELAQVLADALAVIVRCAAQPDFLDILAALERGDQVFVEADASDASAPYIAVDLRPARAVVVGDPAHATCPAATPWSRVLDLVRSGHRKSSGPAHHVVPPDTQGNDHRSDPRCRDSHPSSREDLPRPRRIA